VTITHGYTSLERLKVAANITSPDFDAILEEIIEAKARDIDEFCGRRFWSTSETRYYTALSSYSLMIDDLLSLTSISTDDDGDRVYEVPWDIAGANRDVDVLPANNAILELPYWELRTTPGGLLGFPVGVAHGVEITGVWGGATTTPKTVGMVSLWESLMEWQSILASGQANAGGGEFGRPVAGGGLHPFSQRRLSTFRRRAVA
jgi:hypothetical protein